MTILNTAGEKNFYIEEDNTLARPVDNKLYRVSLDNLKRLTIKELNRIANLDNDSFKILAEIQKAKRS